MKLLNSFEVIKHIILQVAYTPELNWYSTIGMILFSHNINFCNFLYILLRSVQLYILLKMRFRNLVFQYINRESDEYWPYYL